MKKFAESIVGKYNLSKFIAYIEALVNQTSKNGIIIGESLKSPLKSLDSDLNIKEE